MRVATLDLTPELFVNFCKVCKDGPPRYFIVTQNPLPDDAVIVGIGVRPGYESGSITLQLYIRSESFADVPEGSAKPELPLVWFEAVYDEHRD